MGEALLHTGAQPYLLAPMCKEAGERGRGRGRKRLSTSWSREEACSFPSRHALCIHNLNNPYPCFYQFKDSFTPFQSLYLVTLTSKKALFFVQEQEIWSLGPASLGPDV